VVNSGVSAVLELVPIGARGAVGARAARMGMSRAGMALVDAIVAVIILGAALSVILSLSGQALSSQRRGDDLAAAAMLADEQLALVLARGPDDYAKTFPVRGECDAPFERFRFALDITGGSAIEPFKVRVTIAWDDAARERTAVVETLLASRGGSKAAAPTQGDRQPTQPVERVQ